MAIDNRTLIPGFLSGDDVAFRAWGSGIAAQIAAMGLVQTSDTGQINWATAVQAGGYEIWRFNDVLQATKPVFLKINYSASGGTKGLLSVTVGTATNGAGTLTGQVGAARGGVGAGGMTTGPSYCSGGPSRLNLVTGMHPTANSNTAQLQFVERTKDANGVDTGDGIIHCTVTGGATASQQVIPFSGPIPAHTTSGFASISPLVGQSSVATSVGLAPVFAIVAGRFFYVSWFVYPSTDLPRLGLIDLAYLGSTHKFLLLGDGYLTTGLETQGKISMQHSIGMLWE